MCLINGHYRIFVWRSQLILCPFLRPLCFIINVCNKCITSSLVNDDLRIMTTINSSDGSYFMYCAFMTVLMFEQLSATCTARMRS